MRPRSSLRFGSTPRPTRWPVWWALAGIGLVAGLALAAVLALPQLTTTSPAPDAQNVSPHAPLKLTFNRPMNAASVESMLRLTPPLTGTLTAEGNRLIFTPAVPWPEKTVITVTLNGGKSTVGLPLLGSHVWTFSVAGERIAFLKGSTSNLWLIPLDANASPQAVTDEPNGIYNYSLSPDGTQAAIAALRADGGADLCLVALDGSGTTTLVACPGAACLSPVFSPDGARLAYERQAVISSTVESASFGDSRVHLYTLATGADEIQPEADADTRFPRWSPDGRLSYFDTERKAIVVRDLTSGAVTYIPNGTGDMGSWSPDAQTLVYPEIFAPPGDNDLPGEDFPDRFYSRLLRVVVATNQTQNLSGEGLITDASPVYSPSGEWIVFGRRGLSPSTWTLGRQIWLMRADGSQARQLTSEPTYNHSAFVWSADESALIYMRYNAGDPVAPAEIWMMNRDGTGARQITIGYLPEWVP